MGVRRLPKLADKTLCTGCSACANVCPQQCITMIEDNDGFTYPQINSDLCVECHLCEKSCPVLNKKDIDIVMRNAYAAISSDNFVRNESSSGGIFSELALEILKSGGVIFGASYGKSGVVEHICVDNVESLWKLRGAKYSQSYLGDTFIEVKKHLLLGENVLFSGTPCQVAGLKAFLRRDFDNLFCIDFVCHGVPSPMVWREYVKHRSLKDNDGKLPTMINLRNKETGWSRYSYSVKFDYSDNKNYMCKNNSDLYMQLFVNDYILRKSCSNCQFKGYDRISDITLGDFWGIWDIDSSMDDNKGTSMVLTHSKKGEHLFNSILSRINCKPVTLEQASKMNPSLLYSSVHKEVRNQLLEEIRNNGFQGAQRYVQQERQVGSSMKGKLHKFIHKIIHK